MRYMVIYQKYNGDILYRTTKNRPIYNKGDKTSMGWKVLDIKRLYKGKCYSTYEFDNILDRKKMVHDILYHFNKNVLFDTLKLILLLSAVYYLFVKF